jgi:hypothetical protein
VRSRPYSSYASFPRFSRRNVELATPHADALIVRQEICRRHDPSLIIVRRGCVADTATAVSTSADECHEQAVSISNAGFESGGMALNRGRLLHGIPSRGSSERERAMVGFYPSRKSRGFAFAAISTRGTAAGRSEGLQHPIAMI